MSCAVMIDFSGHCLGEADQQQGAHCNLRLFAALILQYY